MNNQGHLRGQPIRATLDLSPIGRSENSERRLSPSRYENVSIHGRLGSQNQSQLSPHMRHDIFLLAGRLEISDTPPLNAGDFISLCVKKETPLIGHAASFLRYSHPMATNCFVHRSNRNDQKPRPARARGLTVTPLHNRSGDHTVSLVEWSAGASIQNHNHLFGEEILILSGELEDQHGHHGIGTWLRFYPGAHHAPRANRPTKILLRNSFLQDEARAAE